MSPSQLAWTNMELSFKDEQLTVHAPRLALSDWKNEGLPDWVVKKKGLPGNVIHFGDPERRVPFAKMLKDAVIVDNLFKEGERGRAPLVIGVYPYKYKEGGSERTFDVPVIGLGTGMGQASTKIMLYDSLGYVSIDPVYMVGGQELRTGGRINLIRVGTCGGCNTTELDPPVVNRPALVNSTVNYSTGAVVMEGLGWPPMVLGLPRDNPQRAEFERLWAGFGGGVIEDRASLVFREEKGKTSFHGAVAALLKLENSWEADLWVPMRPEMRIMHHVWTFLSNKNSPTIVRAISKSAGEIGVECHQGAALSKDSLDLENHGHVIQLLRRKYGVIASEMEQFTANFVASFLDRVGGIKTRAGMVTVVVGSLPGTGYPEKGNKQHEQEIATGTDSALKVALESLSRLALETHKRSGGK